VFRYVSLITKNALRNRRRSILTICSIAASLCLLSLLLAIYNALYLSDTPPAQARRLVTRNKISLTVPMPVYYRDRIRQVPGVVAVGVNQWFGGIYKDERDPNNFFARFAVDPDALLTIQSEYRIPEDQKEAFLRDRTGCLVGAALAKRLGFKLGDKVLLRGDIFPGDYEFTIRAIYEADEGDDVMFFHINYLYESLPVGRRDFAGTFTILIDDPDSATSIAKAIDSLFENATVQTRTETERQFALSFIAFLGNVKMFLFSISAALTFTILLVSANTMAMSVRERIREVGVLKTLGFTSRAIMGIIVAEAAFIGVAGGIVGCIFASLLCAALRQAPAYLQIVSGLRLESYVIAVSLLIAALIGVVSSFVPAWSASRTKIVEALKFSG